MSSYIIRQCRHHWRNTLDRLRPSCFYMHFNNPLFALSQILLVCFELFIHFFKLLYVSLNVTPVGYK